MPERFSFFKPSKKVKKFKSGPSFAQRYGKHWPALRLKILTRDNWQCCLCGRLLQGAYEGQVDHKIRKSQGGSDSEDNLWSLCLRCHGRKSYEERKSS